MTAFAPVVFLLASRGRLFWVQTDENVTFHRIEKLFFLLVLTLPETFETMSLKKSKCTRVGLLVWKHFTIEILHITPLK